MRRAVALLVSAGFALAAAGCGGVHTHNAAQTGARSSATASTFTGTIAPGMSTVRTRTTPAPPTAAAIRQAAARTAAEPGFAAQVSGTITARALGGNPVAFTGNGHFDPRSGSGTLNLAVTLPGLLGIGGALPTQVVLDGEKAYVQVPAELASVVPASEQWLEGTSPRSGSTPTSAPPRSCVRSRATRSATSPGSAPGSRSIRPAACCRA